MADDREHGFRDACGLCRDVPDETMGFLWSMSGTE